MKGYTMEPTLPEVLTTIQAAELLQLRPALVSILAHRGKIPARKLGKEWRFHRAQLVAFIRGEWSPPVNVEKRKRGRPAKVTPLPDPDLVARLRMH